MVRIINVTIKHVYHLRRIFCFLYLLPIIIFLLGILVSYAAFPMSERRSLPKKGGHLKKTPQLKTTRNNRLFEPLCNLFQ